MALMCRCGTRLSAVVYLLSEMRGRKALYIEPAEEHRFERDNQTLSQLLPYDSNLLAVTQIMAKPSDDRDSDRLYIAFVHQCRR